VVDARCQSTEGSLVSIPRVVQNRIEDSAQPFPDMEAAGMPRFVFTVTIDLYHACWPA